MSGNRTTRELLLFRLPQIRQCITCPTPFSSFSQVNLTFLLTEVPHIGHFVQTFSLDNPSTFRYQALRQLILPYSSKPPRIELTESYFDNFLSGASLISVSADTVFDSMTSSGTRLLDTSRIPSFLRMAFAASG